MPKRNLPPGIGSLIACLLAAMLAHTPSALHASVAQDGGINFSRDVRPILADKCLGCHGPDEAMRKGKLRLDREAESRKDRGGHAAIVPGNPEESDLIFRIETDDPTTRMPPADSGKSLTPKQVETLRAWVAQGGDYTEHWAFVPPTRPPLPSVSNPEWVRTPIDAFVLARLDREQLKPAPEAPRATLIRRLSLDLIGLPPTVAEVDQFVNDTAPDAYERVVERLLASPHYGEKWGRWWLDAARYADSDGYEKDKPRFVWFYRDWVINALNQDMPYDQFIREQIAGDLLPDATQDQRVATGFLRNSMINEEGGIDPEQFRMEAMFDRMDAIGTGILGLTLRCAQCHTHKYDPISHEDYYRMFAFINNCHEANVAVYTSAEQARLHELQAKISDIEATLKTQDPDWVAHMADWETSLVEDRTRWSVVTPSVDEDSTGGQKYLLQADGSFLAQGYAPTKHTVKMTVNVNQPRITAFRLELMNDPNLPRGGPGRSIHGTAALTEFQVTAAPADHPEKTQVVKFHCATADSNPTEAPLESIYDDKSNRKRSIGPVSFAIDGNQDTAWGTETGPANRNEPRVAVFVAEHPLLNRAGTILTFALAQNHGGWNSDDNQNCNLGRFRLSISGDHHPSADDVPIGVKQILAKASATRTAADNQVVFSHWRTTVPEWTEQNDEILRLQRQFPNGSTQLVLQNRMEPRQTHVLNRGDFLKPAKPVEPGTPAALNPLQSEGVEPRLAFAHWLANRESPTTARSLVNRIWQSDFGIGLVESSEDLGTQGAMPSHPELLDWLAVEFMENGWRMKELHRTIFLSNTYRQASDVTPALYARDPANRLLARGPRFRLDGELVRDMALATSGLLNPAVGGPSVQPPAPEFLFQPPTSYGPKVWIEAKGPDRYRRALYTFRYRSVPYPALQAFDTPNADIACSRRNRSNTPLQALTTLNEPIMMECARAIALDAMWHGGSSDLERLVHAFRRCLARQPTSAESVALLQLFVDQQKHFSANNANPWDLVANDPTSPPKLPAEISPAQAAAWTSVARVLLNLDETISKE